MVVAVSAAEPSTTMRILDWFLRIVVGVAFLAAAAAKIAGVQPMVDMFQHIGLGQSFRYVTAAFEIAGGLMILLPRTAVYGALLLVLVMVGALLTHFLIIGGNPAPAFVLLLLNVAVLWLRRRQIRTV